MTFPTTGVLDNFNRANATTLGTNWSVLVAYGSDGDMGISSNAAYNPDAGVYSYMYWNPATYGPDCECYLTLTTLVAADARSLVIRIQQPTGSYDGYGLLVDPDPTPDEWTVSRIDNEVWTQLGAVISQNVVNGEKIGLEAIGSDIAAYHYTGGAWSQKLTRSDATYSNAGNTGFYGTSDTAWRYDDFGGGTVVAAGVAIPVFMNQYRQRCT